MTEPIRTLADAIIYFAADYDADLGAKLEHAGYEPKWFHYIERDVENPPVVEYDPYSGYFRFIEADVKKLSELEPEHLRLIRLNSLKQIIVPTESPQPTRDTPMKIVFRAHTHDLKHELYVFEDDEGTYRLDERTWGVSTNRRSLIQLHELHNKVRQFMQNRRNLEGIDFKVDYDILPEEKTVAERIVDSILEDLRDRRGFDHAWDDCDEEIQHEVRSMWLRIIEHHLPEED